MSGSTDAKECPYCGNQATQYTDWKPFDRTSIECMHCGLTIYPIVDIMDKEELKEMRKEFNENNEIEFVPEKPKASKENMKYFKSIYGKTPTSQYIKQLECIIKQMHNKSSLTKKEKKMIEIIDKR